MTDADFIYTLFGPHKDKGVPNVYCEPCDRSMPCNCNCDTCEIRLERLESYMREVITDAETS